MTHDELIERAIKWLYGTERCWAVLSEVHSNAREIPDAIGWQFGGRVSILVECKTSRSDFFADAHHKFAHRDYLGMGNYRYYMTVPGLVKVEELPEKWGLLEVYPRQVRHKRWATKRSYTQYPRIAQMERFLMVAGLRMYTQREEGCDDLRETETHETGQEPR
ncbi:MAG: hypothetical protein DRH97_04405 [Chloroflexi bacterium]|nr:MAG: hypothetical protein DRH97_04405 [Chloroflexota bacterium]